MFLTIGERLNATRKDIAAALRERNADRIREEISKQIEGGADLIDINGGTTPEQELDNVVWMTEIASTACAAPLCIDSSNPKVIGAAVETCLRARGVAIPEQCETEPGLPWLMTNSITNEPARYDAMLPALAKYNAAVVALCMAGGEADFSIETRLEAGRELVQRLVSDGIAPERIYIDPLVLPVGVDTKNGVSTIAVMTRLKQEFPEARFVCGVSNISHGMPARSALNTAFLTMLIAAGLDAAIVDTTSKKLVSAMRSALALSNRDPYCSDYIKAFRNKMLDA